MAESNKYLRIRDAEKYFRSISESTLIMDNDEIHKAGRMYDVFLSYNHKDITIAKFVYNILKNNHGLSVYVDYNDRSFNRNIVDKKTAQTLCNRLNACKSLIYVHSSNSKNSKWCPWEIGLASGLKDFKCAIIPCVNESDSEYDKQEYLTLYPEAIYSIASDKTGPYFWVKPTEYSSYKTLDFWVKN